MNHYHDYNIYKYEVDSSNQKIIIFLREHHGEDQVTLIFSGVAGHLLEHALKGNIVLDFEVYESKEFYLHWKNTLMRYQKYGLPLDTDTEENFIKDMAKNKLNCYVLSTSYGLQGWVLATSVSENA